MKKKLVLGIIFFVVLTTLGAFAANASENTTGSLIVLINGFPDSQGAAMVALSNSATNYQEKSAKAFKRKMAEIENNSARLVFNDLPYGEYAIALYHDQNSNGEMDKNAMGIPREVYAFSNNARGMFGKPEWEKVRFKIESAENQMTISIK